MVIVLYFYLLLAFSVLSAVVNNCLLHRYDDKNTKGFTDVLLFNSLVAVIWVVLLFIKGRGFAPSVPSIVWGVLYGIVIAGFLLSKTLAFSNGPMSLTSLFGCCSMIIPTLFGTIFWKEDVSITQMAGIALLLVAIYMCINPKYNDRLSMKWKICCGIFFVCSGLVGIIFKLHQSSSGKNEIDQMMLVASLISAAILFCSAVCSGKIKEGRMPILDKRTMGYVVFCGLFSCVYNRLNVYLTGVMPSVIFFPAFNGGVILFSTAAGFALFREKIKIMQICGLVLGLLALLLIGIVF